MFRLLEMTDLCMRFKISLLFEPRNFLRGVSISTLQSPSTSMITLICLMVYPWYCALSSHLRGSYLRVFSLAFLLRFSIHGQLISMVVTVFFWWLITLASTWFALTSLCSANTGMSQYACTSQFSYSGFGFIIIITVTNIIIIIIILSKWTNKADA